LSGFTGSGKTAALTALTNSGEILVDLEGIAEHRGSAFGDVDGVTQPTQEMFENILAMSLNTAHERAIATGERIWIEDESQRIGLVNIPMPFWNTMRCSPIYLLDIPFEERLEYIVAEYGKMKTDRLINAIVRIRKRLGGLDAKNAINLAVEGDIRGCFRILLQYYDKHYEKGLRNRENLDMLLTKIQSDTTDPHTNSKTIKQVKLQVNGA
jgi:tRNA 2-selenouridine synthase